MTIPFGRQFRKEYFEFDPDYIPLNNGSFGASPKVVREFASAERARQRANADLYFRYDLLDRLAVGRNAVASVVDADPKNLAFVQNATVGVNTVLRSIPFKKGDVVVSASTTYGGCANTLKFLAEKIGIINVLVTLNYPMSSDEVVAEYEQAIEKGKALGEVKMLFFDTVSSMPAARLPWERLVKLSKDNGLLSFVDAAHCIGLVGGISLNTVQPDFFITNMHKWFYVPTPAALLYVDPKHHRAIQTFPISHSYVPNDGSALPVGVQENLLHHKFGFMSTCDYTHYVAAAKAAEFRREVCGGEEAIQKYCYDLAKAAAKLFADELNGEILHGGDATDLSIATSMINVHIPLEGVPDSELWLATASIQENLLRKYKVFIPLSVYRSRAFVRLSAETYVEMADFEDGLKALKLAIKDYQDSLTAKVQTLKV